MKCLAIETSCDETAIAILEFNRKSVNVLANVIDSQIRKHQQYGGVVPEVASRQHLLNILPTLDKAVDKAGCKLKEIDIIGVTVGPGLASALLVGIDTAKSLGFVLNKPVIGVNHIEGHILAGLMDLQDLDKFKKYVPALCLTVSGGHTWLVKVMGLNDYQIIGKTLDDAAGEAFDKVAIYLGLDYPGGPEISRLAKNGDPGFFRFPRPMLKSPGFDFSFSGLKTAVFREITKQKHLGSKTKQNIAASFEEAITDTLLKKTLEASESLGIRNLVLTGGVSVNARLRDKFSKLPDHNVVLPLPEMSTDNATMIGVATFFAYKQNRGLELKPQPKLRLS